MRKIFIEALWLFAITLLFAGSACAGDTVYYYYNDAQGNPVVVTDAHGNVVERTYYGPYGEVLNRPLRDGPGYTGHEEDAATGLVYMQQRYYAPQIKRFPSVDPVDVDTSTGANFNRYWYANDNPYRYTDPDGRQVGEVAVVVAAGCAESVGCAATVAAGLTYAGKKAGDAGVKLYDHIMQSKESKTKDGSHQAGDEVKEVEGKRPFSGEPGSTVRGKDGSRTYGEDGYPKTDRDRPHPAEQGKQGGEDHSHDWGRPPGGGPPKNEDRGPSRAPQSGDPPPPRDIPKPPQEEH